MSPHGVFKQKGKEKRRFVKRLFLAFTPIENRTRAGLRLKAKLKIVVSLNKGISIRSISISQLNALLHLHL